MKCSVCGEEIQFPDKGCPKWEKVDLYANNPHPTILSVELIDGSGVAWERVIFHCFTEGAAEMAELTKRGGFGSFTGVLTYKSAENVRAAARAQGLQRLMLETDAPFLTPMPHRGKPNEPALMRHTAEYAAGLFGVELQEIAEVSTRNARAFFGL